MSKDNDNYAEKVDHLVESMNYDEKFNYFRSLPIREQLDNIRNIGRKLDGQLSGIIGQLDTILNNEFDPDKVTCTIDDKEVDCNTWDEGEGNE